MTTIKVGSCLSVGLNVRNEVAGCLVSEMNGPMAAAVGYQPGGNPEGTLRPPVLPSKVYSGGGAGGWP